MKNLPILYGVIGLLVGLLIAGTAAVLAVNNDNHSIMRMVGMNTEHTHEKQATNHSEMSMSEMSEQLQDKSGDEFDKAFIEMMIAHHEGAINMANLIPARAKHEEIKKLGLDIINAQSKEIAQMRQ